ncbi:MAG: ParB/Srx family N-terminal domain-containing protein, partial [Sphingomonas sp.]
MDTKLDAARETDLAIEYLPIASLTPDPKNARKHSAKQVQKLAHIIENVGWSTPIVIFKDGMIGAGHARLAAAKLLGMTEVPCVRITRDLSTAERKALAIADNAMTDASRFDDKVLRDVLMELADLDFDLTLTGLEMGVIDFLIDGPASDAPIDPADTFAAPEHDRPAVTRQGDLWLLEPHKLLCGDALEASSYEQLLGEDRAAMVFSDP